MRILALMLGSIAGIGLISLIVIFQPEIRRMLLLIGDKTLKGRYAFLDTFFKQSNLDFSEQAALLSNELVEALSHLSKSKTGALILLTRTEIASLAKTGVLIDAKLSANILENIFFKNAPMHDGAVIVQNDKLVAASCILPVSANPNLPEEVGLRHRAALGATESTNLLALIVSEENGDISYAKDGKLFYNVSMKELELKIQQYYTELEI